MEPIVSKADRHAFSDMSEDMNDEKGEFGVAEAWIGRSA